MRYITPYVQKDLKKKMVFIGGPRQSGKTTLARAVLKDWDSGAYFNWDRATDRKKILSEGWSDTDSLLVFDEIHKFPKWKSLVKGYFDTLSDKHRFLVTGSARLDFYRKGGDSLFGRYHYWRLHPFSLSELPKGVGDREGFDRLMRVGGFPEPFLDNDEREARRWREERYERLLREDARDLSRIADIQTLGLLLDLLRGRVGGPIVARNLGEDLQISPITVSKWINILERLYILFIVKPYSTNIARAIQKMPKVYFYDNADVEGDEGARFENFVASHLLKHIQFLRDRDGNRFELASLRDKDDHEVDFVVLKDRKPHFLIEAKWSDSQPSKGLLYFSERLKPSASIQVVANLKRSYKKGRLHVLSPYEFLKDLEMKIR